MGIVMLFLLQVIWLGLPAALANISAPIATRLFPHLSYPLDCNHMFRGKRLLGPTKTIRGLIVGIFIGQCTFLLQQTISMHTSHINILPYQHLPWYFGFLFGIGALGGDSIKSFFKRQLGIAPSTTWFPFDQLDWLIGTLVLLLIFVPIPWTIIVTGLVLGIILHVIVKFVGFRLGIDSQPI